MASTFFNLLSPGPSTTFNIPVGKVAETLSKKTNHKIHSSDSSASKCPQISAISFLQKRGRRVKGHLKLFQNSSVLVGTSFPKKAGWQNSTSWCTRADLANQREQEGSHRVLMIVCLCRLILFSKKKLKYIITATRWWRRHPDFKKAFSWKL